MVRKEEKVENKQLLSGKKFVFTGSLKEFTRSQIKEVVTAVGGKVSSSVSKNTDYVVVGTNPGSKYDKAQELGIPVLTEKEFIDILNIGG